MPDAIWKKICWPIFNPGTVREMVGCRNPNYNAAVNEVNDDEGTTSTHLLKRFSKKNGQTLERKLGEYGQNWEHEGNFPMIDLTLIRMNYALSATVLFQASSIKSSSSDELNFGL